MWSMPGGNRIWEGTAAPHRDRHGAPAGADDYVVKGGLRCERGVCKVVGRSGRVGAEVRRRGGGSARCEPVGRVKAVRPRFSIASVWCGVIACVMIALATSAPAQGNLGFLRNTPLQSFNEQDRALLREAMAEVLNSSDPTASRTWKNDATGSGGTIQSLARFDTADGRECRQLHMQNRRTRGESDALTMSVCRDDNGEWRADANASPAGEPK